MNVRLKALLGTNKLKDMSTDEIAQEVAAMTYTDHRIVQYAVQDEKEAVRIANDVRSISRRRLISMAFAGVAGFAGIQAQLNLDDLSEAAGEESFAEMERLKGYIKNPETIDPDLVKEASEKRSKESLKTLFNSMGLFVIAGIATFVSGFYSNRRNMHRSDIKQIADMNRRDVMIASLEAFTKGPKQS